MVTCRMPSEETRRSPNTSELLPGLRRLLSDQLGITGVQFALILPALLGAVMGTMEMGQMLMAQNTLVHAANEATRYAMVRSSSADHAATENDIVTFVKENMTGLDTNQAIVSVNWVPENQPGARVTVNVDYPYEFSSLAIGPVSLSGSSSTFITH